MGMNVVAKASVAWWLDITLTCRVLGAVAALMVATRWESEAVVGSPLPTVGGSGIIHGPVSTAPAVGATFDSTLEQQVDLRYTPSLATASETLHQYSLIALN